MIKSLSLCLFATFLLVSGCEVLAPVVGPDASRADRYRKRVVYHRGPCYGRCPVYTLSLYENGLLVYEGERFSTKPGTWQRSIDRRRSDALLDSFARADFRNYPRAFRKQIPDLASVDMTYIAPDATSYTTSYADYAPPELLALDRTMRRLADLEGYRQVSDTLQGLFSSKTSYRHDKREAIVQLRPGVVPETWVIKHGKQGVSLKRRIAPNGDYYLLEFDPNVTPTDNLLDRLRADTDVLSAQLNQRVQPR